MSLAPLTRWLLACDVPAADLDLDVVRDAIWMALVTAAENEATHFVSELGPESDSAPVPGVEPTSTTFPTLTSAAETPPDTTTDDPVHSGLVDDLVDTAAQTDLSAAASLGRATTASIDQPAPLPGALALTRALKPFQRVRQTGRRSRFDVEATIRATVEAGGRLQVMTTAVPEPELTAHLVIDDSVTMQVWAEPLAAFGDVLQRANVFRSVCIWKLVPGPIVELRASPHGTNATQPPWLSGRQADLVIVASDTRDPQWRFDAIWNALAGWGHHSSVAFLNPLPPPWWIRTAMPYPSVRVFPSAGRRANVAMAARLPRSLQTSIKGRTVTPLPVLGLNPGEILTWGRSVSSGQQDGCAGVLVVDQAARSRSESGRTPLEALAVFRRLATPAARRLVTLLSAASVHTLETMRVVQHDLVPGSGVSELAEVLASGAFRNDSAGDFVFDADVRDLLHAELYAEDVYDVVDSIQRALERKRGSYGGSVLLDNPTGDIVLDPGQAALELALSQALEAAGPSPLQEINVQRAAQSASVNDLQAVIRASGTRWQFDLTWTPPSTGRVEIYRTPVAPLVLQPETVDEFALETAGLASGLRLEHPTVRAPEGKMSMLDVPFPKGWDRVFFTPVTMLEGKAQIGRSVSPVITPKPSDPIIVERTEYQLLRFGWPRNAPVVAVSIGPIGAEPTGPEQGPTYTEISRETYDRQGALQFSARLPSMGCSVHLAGVAFFDRQRIYGEPAVVGYPGQLRFAYSVEFRQRLFRLDRVVIRLVCDGEIASCPPFVLIHNGDRLPLHRSDGELLQVVLDSDAVTIPTRQFRPDRLGPSSNPAYSADVRRRSGFVRVFADLPPEVLRSVAVLDPPVKSLMIPSGASLSGDLH